MCADRKRLFMDFNWKIHKSYEGIWLQTKSRRSHFVYKPFRERRGKVYVDDIIVTGNDEKKEGRIEIKTSRGI